jgi:TatD family-associated radical SAM protein
MTVTYTVGDGLYLNITNKCTNSCDFCIRNEGDGAYGSDSLWLEREPTLDEIKAEIDKSEPEKYKEIVFCGYGEPTSRLYDMLEVAKYIKSEYNIPVRLNTNGQANLMYNKDCTPLFEGCFDTVSISLNSPTPEGYDKVCHSEYGLLALPGIIDFAEKLKAYVNNVVFTVVSGFVSDNEIEASRLIAEKAGVAFRVREFV